MIHFDNIKNGKKIYETRVYDKKRKEIKLGDTIILIIDIILIYHLIKQ